MAKCIITPFNFWIAICFLFFLNGRFVTSSTNEMVYVKGGVFEMGADSSDIFAAYDEFPKHKRKISSFFIDINETTNAEFEEFVIANDFKTTAELKGFSMVFFQDSINGFGWKEVKGANWKQPFGIGSHINNSKNHPVVHVSHKDAVAFLKWKGKRLPTEAEWEYAAKKGIHKNTTCGANLFQGQFPNLNLLNDGFLYTATVGSYKPNALGVYDMAGNVWEWCEDYYHERWYVYCVQQKIKSATGPQQAYHPEKLNSTDRVIRGGSFLCNESYCAGYRPTARNKAEEEASYNHVGFRGVRSER